MFPQNTIWCCVGSGKQRCPLANWCDTNNTLFVTWTWGGVCTTKMNSKNPKNKPEITDYYNWHIAESLIYSGLRRPQKKQRLVSTHFYVINTVNYLLDGLCFQWLWDTEQALIAFVQWSAAANYIYLFIFYLLDSFKVASELTAV